MAASEVRKYIQAIVGDMSNLPISGVVQSVDNETCSVELVGGLVVSDVRLKATVSDGDKKLLLTPKIGSTVLMLSSDLTVSNLTVIAIDEVEKIEILTDSLSIVVDDKVSIKNDSANLMDVFSDLFALLRTFQVTTPIGPSGAVLSPTIQKIDAVEKDIKTLFK